LFDSSDLGGRRFALSRILCRVSSDTFFPFLPGLPIKDLRIFSRDSWGSGGTHPREQYLLNPFFTFDGTVKNDFPHV
jgi:hypothetical protein